MRRTSWPLEVNNREAPATTPLVVGHTKLILHESHYCQNQVLLQVHSYIKCVNSRVIQQGYIQFSCLESMFCSLPTNGSPCSPILKKMWTTRTTRTTRGFNSGSVSIDIHVKMSYFALEINTLATWYKHQFWSPFLDFTSVTTAWWVSCYVPHQLQQIYAGADSG